MKTKRVFPLTMTLVLALKLSAYCAVGGQPGEIFDWGMGARSLGMGKAFTAVADDASSAYWNPANMQLLNSQEASFLHSTLWEGTNYDAISYVFPTAQRKAFGLTVVQAGERRV